MAPLERILSTAASRRPGSVPPDGEKAAATHALWICACVTFDDAPIWLIYDHDDDGIVWQQVPYEAEPLDLVDTDHIACGHADPADVLAWLQGDAPNPWAGGDGSGDPSVLIELRRKIRSE